MKARYSESLEFSKYIYIYIFEDCSMKVNSGVAHFYPITGF